MEVTQYPILEFKDYLSLEKWFEKNAESSNGFWLRFYKKSSGKITVTYDEAVELSLCFGWIDSQAKGYDEESYLQKFTPRRKKSIWSYINTKKVEDLLRKGKIRASGLRAVEEAKADGRWERAYNPPSTIELPREFLDALHNNKKAFEFYQTLNKTNTYAIAWRLATAKKEETRERRIQQIVTMLEKHEKFH